MKKMLIRLAKIDNWEKEEKLFVIAMIMMAIFNFALVLFLLTK